MVFESRRTETSSSVFILLFSKDRLLFTFFATYINVEPSYRYIEHRPFFFDFRFLPNLLQIPCATHFGDNVTTHHLYLIRALLTTSRMAEDIEPEESPSPPAQMVDEPDERPRVDEPWERPRTQVSASIGRRRRCRRLMVIITYPCVIVLFVIFLLLLITFCLFPMSVCLTLGVCIYYCLVEGKR